ncbi:MAG: DUF1501 domain-containing protein [Pirellulaceae bacterium]|nr:DUF1501 domain-containing protein [Pirellulaceae bacterium]
MSRRAFLGENALGIGAFALATLLADEQLLAVPKKVKAGRHVFDLKPKTTHFAPRAKAMISLFQHGGPAHMDLMDPKPELSRLDGKTYAGDVGYSFIKRASKRLKGTPFKFSSHGECGTEVSELLPGLASIVDDVCIIRSMHTGHNGHEVSIRYLNSGIAGVTGRPSLGSWLTYGLGSESQDLPAYMVLTDPGGHPVDGVHNWSNGWMPSLFQGTVLRPKEPRILNLDAPVHLRGKVQEHNLSFLNQINRRHLARHPGENDLEARIASYELAARMQHSAREALDVSQETKATHQMYGLDQDATREYGTRCLIARRLVERGVRFVQLFHSGQPWDNHNNLTSSLPSACKKTDKPSAALVKDLKQRGMLDEVLVHWGGEIGRLPVTEGDPKSGGRDHNGQGFSTWLAGGGVQGGLTYGNTDEVGHRAAENIVKAHDYQATVLHLFGLDHQQLYYLYNGQEQKLVTFEARVVKEIFK